MAAPHRSTTLPKQVASCAAHAYRCQASNKSFSGSVRETGSEAITTGAAASRYAAPQPRAAPHQPVVSGGRVHDRHAHARAYRACTGLIFVCSRYRR